MPRPRKGSSPNAIVASAARVMAGRRKNRPQQTSGGWQDEAWTMLDSVGELEFYREWVSNACSRVTLHAVEVLPDKSEKPAEDPTVLAAMAALFDGEAGQSEMMAAMGGHLAVPGETWLAGLVEPPEDPTIDQWRVLSHSEVTEQGKSWVIDRGDAEPEKYDGEQVYMTRIWRPHPRKYVEAHSSVRSALPILRQLVGFDKHIAATIDSRLAGAGLLLLPSEATFTSPQGPDGEATPDEDPLMAALIDAMMAAIQDRGDVSALAPIIARMPGAYIDKVKHLTFWTEFSKDAQALRQETIRRLANSLDVPAEVLTGMADVNHWTGWLLDENAIKMHIEPVVGVASHGLTTRYLWPCLQGNAERLDPGLRRFRIKTDTSALRQRPNRSAEAQALHSSITITDAALARETGFDTGDLLLPEGDTAEEFRRRTLMRLASTGTPDVVLAALDALGMGITVTQPAEPKPAPLPAPAPPPPALESRDLPEQPSPDQAAALLAVSEVLVLRAVERGWNRAGRRGKVRRPVDAANLDAALTGAWENLDRSAILMGADPVRLRDCLDTYARGLLTSGADHDPNLLADLLRQRVLGQ